MAALENNVDRTSPRVPQAAPKKLNATLSYLERRSMNENTEVLLFSRFQLKINKEGSFENDFRILSRIQVQRGRKER